MYYPHHRRHDTESGQGVPDHRQAVRRDFRFVFVGFDLFIHQRFDFEGVHVAADDQTQIVDDKFEHHRIRKDPRIAGEDLALFRIFNIAFQGEHPLLTRLGHQAIEQRQQVHIHTFGVFRTTE